MVSEVINAQPAMIRNILKNECTQQVNRDGTVSLFLAHRLSSSVVEEIKTEASIRIPGIGFYSKNGNQFSWTLRILSVTENGIHCHFVFNDYSNRIANF